MTTIIISIIFSTLFMLTIVPYFRKLAININFLDNPSCERKIHTAPVPAVGGITIFITLIVSGLLFWYIIPTINKQLLSLIGFTIPLLITGIVDDKKEINPIVKLVIQFCSAHLILSSGMLESIYIYNENQIFLYALQYLFILFFIVGVTNAFNLMDGIDGLAGSLFLLGFLWISLTALVVNRIDILLLSLVISSSLIVFIIYNFSQKHKIFMGDGGTLFLSLLMLGMYFLVHQHATDSIPTLANFSIVGFLAIIALPTIDAVYVFGNRIKNRRSPFTPDRKHLHHKLLHFRPNHAKVTSLIIKMILFVLFVAMLLNFVMASTAVIFFMVLFYGLIYLFLEANASMQKHKLILSSIEKNSI